MSWKTICIGIFLIFLFILSIARNEAESDRAARGSECLRDNAPHTESEKRQMCENISESPLEGIDLSPRSESPSIPSDDGDDHAR